MDTIGSRLRELRGRTYFSRTEVAKRLDVSDRIVYGWEKDQYRPTGEHLRALAELYRTTPQYVETGETAPPPNLQEQLDANARMLEQLDRKLDMLAETVGTATQLTTEQLSALARLEVLTDQLETRLPAPTQPQTGGSGTSRGKRAKSREATSAPAPVRSPQTRTRQPRPSASSATLQTPRLQSFVG